MDDRDGGNNEAGDTPGVLRQVRSTEQFRVLRKASEGSDGGREGEGEGEEEEESERLKTPSPATGQAPVLPVCKSSKGIKKITFREEESHN